MLFGSRVERLEKERPYVNDLERPLGRADVVS
jgi:hypothetical protein